MPTPSSKFWSNRNVLLTGHTGFKGAWLALWLTHLGARVTGASLSPNKEPNLYSLVGGVVENEIITDIRNITEMKYIISETRPEIIFHLAAQALVLPSYSDPLDTVGTNVMGTANLLDCAKNLECVRVIMITTTDKVYLDNRLDKPYKENDQLGGRDPYSASKAAAEILIAGYRDSFFSGKRVGLASARAGNVIGGGDWAVDRLVPDATRAWSAGETLVIRNPQAVRPWQHVLDALAGYLQLSEKLYFQPQLSGPYNFGPDSRDAATVESVINMGKEIFQNGSCAVTRETDMPYEADSLLLDSSKALAVLGFSPVWHLSDAIHRTFSWYREYEQTGNARTLCETDINAYERASSGNHE
jgi:CDP-glucose 4,6-dehydratase